MSEKPKPLDFEEIWQIIEDVFIRHYEERICDVSNVDLRSEYKQCYCDVLLEDLRKQKNEIKQHIKSACDFYLRYKNHSDLLMVEYPEYKNKIVELRKKLPSWHDKKMIYNDWLFKLAFKDVFKEVEK